MICPSCAKKLAWQELPLDQTLTAATILEHVSTWPEQTHIEVRRCGSCGRPIARTVRCGKPSGREDVH